MYQETCKQFVLIVNKSIILTPSHYLRKLPTLYIYSLRNLNKANSRRRHWEILKKLGQSQFLIN